MDSEEAAPKEKVVVWTSEIKCTAITASKDHVGSVFWPQVMTVKKSLVGLTTEDKEYLAAKLCDLAPSTPSSLASVLKLRAPKESRHETDLNRVVANINRIVLGLLRLEKIQSGLPNMVKIVEEV